MRKGQIKLGMGLSEECSQRLIHKLARIYGRRQRVYVVVAFTTPNTNTEQMRIVAIHHKKEQADQHAEGLQKKAWKRGTDTEYTYLKFKVR